MSLTAHKIIKTFHVKYPALELATRSISMPLQTETFLNITTEAGDVIEIEYEGDARILQSHKTGHNVFIAKIPGST